MENKGLGNEIGFYIFDYDPSQELLVREHINFLKRKVVDEIYGTSTIEFDLYVIVLEILESKGYLEKVFELERQKGTDYLLKPIKNTLRLTQRDDLVVRYIRERVEEETIIFLTGIGKVWPIIRSHTILNVLHAAIDQVPLIMFYPGTYTGQGLKLFDDIDDQNYYRAFKLIER